MTISSAQRLQREASQSQAVNGNSARDTAHSGTIPTQIIDPTQRREDVGSWKFSMRLKLMTQVQKYGLF
jgi:hypothetical protein